MCFCVQFQGTHKLSACVSPLCSAAAADSIVLLSTYFVAGGVFDALHILFHLILIAVLQGGESEAQRDKHSPSLHSRDSNQLCPTLKALLFGPVLGKAHSVAASSEVVLENQGF